MNNITPGLLDRLLGACVAMRAGQGYTLEQYKDSVARDLENLLNTRCALPSVLLEDYPECARSIINYGLVDFAGMSMGSADDRARVCAALKAAIERHEPRLRNVEARIAREPGAINRISFAITATLAGLPQRDAVSFDAVLQPSSLQYSIKRGARGVQP